MNIGALHEELERTRAELERTRAEQERKQAEQYLKSRIAEMEQRDIFERRRAVDLCFQILYGRTASDGEFTFWEAALAGSDGILSLLREQIRSDQTVLKRIGSDLLVDILQPRKDISPLVIPRDMIEPISIVDVGAQLLDFEDHIYSPLMSCCRCELVGFEPLQDAARARMAKESETRILPYFIGDGGAATFHECAFSATSSLYPPNIEKAQLFVGLGEALRIVDRSEVKTTRLDDVPEITACDYLKIDVQGGELDVLKGGRRVLESTLFVHVEVEFEQVYEGQPLFGDVDAELKACGFEFVRLMNFGRSTYKDYPNPLYGSRMLWAEAVYMKSPELIANSWPVRLLKAGYIAHVNYGMVDLTAYLFRLYDEALEGDVYRHYVSELA